MCFKQELHRSVKSMFGKRVPQGLALKVEQKTLIFELATSPSDFYRLVLMLQVRGWGRGVAHGYATGRVVLLSTKKVWLIESQS